MVHCDNGADNSFFLTHYNKKTHECIFSTVATDALLLKHQGISTYSAK